MMRLAMLMPHFPSQTHTFYWREICALRRVGVEVLPISTTRPPAAEVCHAWSREALEATEYLFPPSVGSFLRGLARILGSGPRGWAGCAGLLREARARSLGERVRLAALVPIGAIVASIVRRRGIGHLHAHSCGDVAWICAVASELSGASYSMTLHGPLEHYGGAQSIKWDRARFAITVSRRLRAEVLAALPGLDESKLHVASMGVNLDDFRRSEPYRPAGEGEPLRIVSCGRLHPGKGHADLIAAVGELRERGVDCRLEILGDGPARSELEQRIAELELVGIVTLRGAVGESGVRDALASAHAFALASHDEAIGVATMEAMAMELPVVVTRVGGVGELVEDGVNGLMVEPREPGAIADALQALRSDPDLATRLGRAARATVEARFGADVSARLIADQLGVEPAGPASETARRERACAS